MPKSAAGPRNRVWTLTLILDGVPELTDEATDALYEAGCDDALAGSRNGVVFLDFDREAGSFQDAALSAIASAESAGIGAKVIRIEPDELVTMAEIARRTQRSRESIRQLARGQRGPGSFPPPVANLSQKSPIWRWVEVRRWIELMEGRAAQDEGDDGESTDSLIAVINAALEVRRQIPVKDKALSILRIFLEPPTRQSKPRKKSSAARGEPA